MIEPNIVEERIRAGIEGVAHVAVVDLTGTKDHYEATVVAEAFASMSRVEQHQAVYRALGELMAGPVHALALKTYTPERWAAQES
ncbi:MAG: BolA family transcriptional regulator [Myxococcota bacterium]